MLGLIACLASTRLRYPVEIDCLIRFDDSSITRYRFFLSISLLCLSAVFVGE